MLRWGPPPGLLAPLDLPRCPSAHKLDDLLVRRDGPECPTAQELATLLYDIQQEVLLVKRQQQQQLVLIQRQSQQLEQLAAGVGTLTRQVETLAPRVARLQEVKEPASAAALEVRAASGTVQKDSGPSEAEAEFREPQSALEQLLQSRDEASALQLLRESEVPGLNDLDDCGNSLVHIALCRDLPRVAIAILARADFQKVNAKTARGWSVLHLAAKLGYLEVCQAILGREDFTKKRFNLKVTWKRRRGRCQDKDAWAYGKTAPALAQLQGHQELADFLREAHRP